MLAFFFGSSGPILGIDLYRRVAVGYPSTAFAQIRTGKQVLFFYREGYKLTPLATAELEGANHAQSRSHHRRRLRHSVRF